MTTATATTATTVNPGDASAAIGTARVVGDGMVRRFYAGNEYGREGYIGTLHVLEDHVVAFPGMVTERHLGTVAEARAYAEGIAYAQNLERVTRRRTRAAVTRRR